MIIVISPEQPIDHEHFLVNQLFEKGLDFFHIRKHGLSDEEMRRYICLVDNQYRKQVVLHSCFHLAKEFGVQRLHFKEKDRVQNSHLPFQENYFLSTSVHSIEDFNKLDAQWEYAFYSPVFPSISKEDYGVKQNVLEDLKLKRNPEVHLIGLGGINENNCEKVLNAGANGIAMLGNIWQSEHPLNVFLTCQEKGRSY